MDSFREMVRSCSKIKRRKREDYLFKELLSLSDSDSESDDGSEPLLLQLLTTDLNCEPTRFYKTHEGNYYHHTVANYTEHEFGLYFRMKRRTFEILMNELNPHLPYSQTDRRKMVLFTIYMLAHGENFRSGSSKFGIAVSTAHKLFRDVIAALVNLIPQYIKWPSAERAEEIATRFEMICGVPGVVGVIDACHIPIRPPVVNPSDFCNRKEYHSVLLQGICDDQMLFLDIVAGDPGSKRHAEVLRDSPIGMRLESSPSTILSPHLHIVGDCAYPNSEYIITPFKNNGQLSNKQSELNTRLNTTRLIMKNTFNQLKAKFKRLKYLDIAEMDVIVNVIVACCVLHNFAIIEKDDSPPVASFAADDSDSGDENLECALPTDQKTSLRRDQLVSGMEEKPPMRKRKRKY